MADDSVNTIAASNPIYTLEQNLQILDPFAFNKFGRAVSLSGNRALVSSYGDNIDSGAVYFYEYNGDSWVEKQKITTNENGDSLGITLSISGNRALIGALKSNTSRAPAYIYEYNGTTWQRTHTLSSTDSEFNDRFGRGVLSGDTALITATSADNDTGAAYIFKYDGNSWIQTQRLTASDGVSGDYFGTAMSLDGNRALIGSSKDNRRKGAVYVFDYIDDLWTQTHKLTASDAQINGDFGSSMSLLGDRALIGAPGVYRGTFQWGTTYYFNFDGSSWIESQKLITCEDTQAFRQFGQNVILMEELAIVSAPHFSAGATVPGMVCILNLVDNSFEVYDQINHDTDDNGTFGGSISFSDNKVLIGASGINDNGEKSGAAYVYSVNKIVFENGFE